MGGKLNTKRDGWMEQALLDALASNPPMPLGTLAKVIASEHDRENTRSLHESARRAAKRLAGEDRVVLATVACPTVWLEEDVYVPSSVRRVLVVLLPEQPLPHGYQIAEAVQIGGFGPDREQATAWGWEKDPATTS